MTDVTSSLLSTRSSSEEMVPEPGPPLPSSRELQTSVRTRTRTASELLLDRWGECLAGFP